MNPEISYTLRKYFICGVWHDPGVIYKALEVVWILARDGLTDEPKKDFGGIPVQCSTMCEIPVLERK